MQQIIAPYILKPNRAWESYLQAGLAVIVCSAFNALLLPHGTPVTLFVVYLCGIAFSARLGFGPLILAVLLSIAIFSLYSNPALATLPFSTIPVLLSFSIILALVVMVNSLIVRLDAQDKTAQDRDQLTATLSELSDSFANSIGVLELLKSAEYRLNELTGADSIFFLPDRDGSIMAQSYDQKYRSLNTRELGIADWVYRHQQQAGLGTSTLPGAAGWYLPLVTSTATIGVLGIYPGQRSSFFSSTQRDLLTALAKQIAIAIERRRDSEITEQTKIDSEVERLRSALLASISQDLRTPLTSVTGAVGTLLENDVNLSVEGRRELAQIAYEEAARLNHLVGNLLEMSQIETRAVSLNKVWQTLEDIIGSAVVRLKPNLANHSLRLNVPADLPYLRFDEVLIHRVISYLLENAIKHTPAGTTITVSAHAKASEVIVEVADDGPGLLPGDEKRVFEKFYRALPIKTDGMGLGLTICRAIVELHDGRMWAANQVNGGAAFYFTLPVDDQPQLLDSD